MKFFHNFLIFKKNILLVKKLQILKKFRKLIFCIILKNVNKGGVKNLEWSNVERTIFRNFKITNIKIAKSELIDYFIYEFIVYYYFLKLLEHSKYLITFPNYKMCLNFCKLLNFGNFMIFQIKK